MSLDTAMLTINLVESIIHLVVSIAVVILLAFLANMLYERLQDNRNKNIILVIFTIVTLLVVLQSF